MSSDPFLVPGEGQIVDQPDVLGDEKELEQNDLYRINDECHKQEIIHNHASGM